jgi:hypothetical protein
MSDEVVVTDNRPVEARLLRGQETLHLDGNALFDRVINLRFKRLKGGDFNIRSDYEPVYGRDGSIFFRRCLQKPQIKVSYEQVPGDTVIKCDIEATNFFLDPRLEGTAEESSLGEDETPFLATKAGEDSILEENGNPVREITLQMGYINQFPDWSKSGMADSDEKLKRFFALDNHVFVNNPRAGTAVELRLSVLTTQLKSLPPDKVTVFNCVVGSLHPGMTWEHKDSDLLAGYGDMDFPSRGMTPLEKTFFMLVSRRFLNPALRYYQKDGALMVTEPFVNSLGETMFDAATTDRPAQVDLAPDGCLTVESANLLGVQCLVSQELRKAVGNETDTYIGSLMTDATTSAVEVAPLVEQQRLIMGQLRQIQRAYPRVRWHALNNGDFFCYDALESAKTLFGDTEIQLRQRRQIVTLSAIYDMTIDGLRVVRAPFHGFINPLTTLRVNARYNLGTLVGSYYPKQRHRWLMVVTQKVEFSTTGDENMMTLSCVDIDPEDAPSYDPDTRQITVKRNALAEAAQQRVSRFAFKIVDWEVYKTNGSHSRLQFIAERMVQSAKADGMREEWERAGMIPTVPLAIKVLLERNKALLDTADRKKRNSPEYKTYKQELNALGIFHVPVIYENNPANGEQDGIKYRLPWSPDDDGTLGEAMEDREEQ